jgi:hypothetical protein
MSASHVFDAAKPVMDRTRCPECGARMCLDRVEPDKPDHDRRTFGCPRCQHTESVVVKYR